MHRRQALAVLLASVVAGRAGAQDAAAGARRWAALSLVGDHLTVVTYQPKVGSSVDTNLRETLPLADTLFDKTAVAAAAEALEKARPGSPVAPLLAGAPAQYEGQAEMLRSDVARLAPELAEAVRATGATHLLLVTKRRAEARLHGAKSEVGSGRLEGLGFYIDRTMKMRRSDTGERGVGFLAPYAFMNLAVIETAGMRVLASVPITASTTLSAARSKDSLDPWDVLSPAEKTETLRRMVRREVMAATETALRDAALK